MKIVILFVIMLTGGFGSYLLSMDEKTYKLIGEDYPGNRAEDVKNPGLLWMMGFIFVVSFLGLFSLVPLRKVYYQRSFTYSITLVDKINHYFFLWLWLLLAACF